MWLINLRENRSFYHRTCALCRLDRRSVSSDVCLLRDACSAVQVVLVLPPRVFEIIYSPDDALSLTVMSAASFSQTFVLMFII